MTRFASLSGDDRAFRTFKVTERARVWRLQDEISKAVFEQRPQAQIDQLLEALREAVTMPQGRRDA